MAVNAKSRPSFFMVPDEKVDYKPSVKLGHVIYRVTEPDLLLFPADAETVPIPLGVDESIKELEKYKIVKDTKHTSKYGLIAKILDFFVDLINISRGAERATTSSYEVEKITFHTFSPPKSFLKSLEEQEDVTDYLKNDANASAYLITGIVIAEGVVFKCSHTRKVDKEATVGIKVPNIAEVGPTAQTGNETGETLDYEDKGPTLLAFRVQKLKMKDSKLTATSETEGAYFGEDTQGAHYEVEFNASLDEDDVEGLTSNVVADEFVGEECTIYSTK